MSDRKILHTDGDWCLVESCDGATYYKYFINHACEPVKERLAGDEWLAKQRYFYHDYNSWECDLCHTSCPGGLQALLTMLMTDKRDEDLKARQAGVSWVELENTLRIYTQNNTKITPK